MVNNGINLTTIQRVDRENLVVNAPVAVRSLFYFVKTALNPPLQVLYYNTFTISAQNKEACVHLYIPFIRLAIQVNQPYEEGLVAELENKGIKAAVIEFTPENINTARVDICELILERLRKAIASRSEWVHFDKYNNAGHATVEEEGTKNDRVCACTDTKEKGKRVSRPASSKGSDKSKEATERNKKKECCANCRYVIRKRGNDGRNCMCSINRVSNPFYFRCDTYDSYTKK